MEQFSGDLQLQTRGNAFTTWLVTANWNDFQSSFRFVPSYTGLVSRNNGDVITEVDDDDSKKNHFFKTDLLETAVLIVEVRFVFAL